MLGKPDTVRSPMDGSCGRMGRVRELQINSLFCKPVCKPDAAGRHETGETEPAERDGICPVCRGHHARGRRPETAETHVVWLITQRSRVQIPPPLLISAGQGPFLSGRGPLRDRECDQRKVLVRYAAAGQVRRAGTQRDSAEPGRRHRLRSLGAWPRSSTLHIGFWSFGLDRRLDGEPPGSADVSDLDLALYRQG